MNSNHSRRFAPRAPAIAALLFIAGCLSVDDSANKLAALSIVSGNNQSVRIGSTTAAPLVVGALDNSAAPLPGATVTWTVSQGTGTVSAATTITDESGRTSVTFTPGATTGTTMVKASAEGLSVTFTVEVVAAT